MFKPNSGRKQESCVREYFHYDRSLDKSRCLVWKRDNDDTISKCGQLLIGKNVTNLWGHLWSKHKEVYAALEIKEKQQQSTEKKQTRQTNLNTMVNIYKPHLFKKPTEYL